MAPGAHPPVTVYFAAVPTEYISICGQLFASTHKIVCTRVPPIQRWLTLKENSSKWGLWKRSSSKPTYSQSPKLDLEYLGSKEQLGPWNSVRMKHPSLCPLRWEADAAQTRDRALSGPQTVLGSCRLGVTSHGISLLCRCDDEAGDCTPLGLPSCQPTPGQQAPQPQVTQALSTQT